MIKRFFKVVYVLSLIAIILGVPAFVLASIKWDSVTKTRYRAKCISNGKFVTLQGSPVGEATEFSDTFGAEFGPDLQERFKLEQAENLNFYCTYYDEIQKYIVAYAEAKTSSGQVAANYEWSEFKKSKGGVSSYPELYTREMVTQEHRLEEVYIPLLSGLLVGLFAFLLLQLVRVCCVYVVFGKLVWHPFGAME